MASIASQPSQLNSSNYRITDNFAFTKREAADSRAAALGGGADVPVVRAATDD
jgi:hypothetical protein